MKKVKVKSVKKKEPIVEQEQELDILEFNDKRMKAAKMKAQGPQPMFIPVNNGGAMPLVANSPVEFAAAVKALSDEDSCLSTDTAMVTVVDPRTIYRHSVYEYVYENAQNSAMATDIANTVAEKISTNDKELEFNKHFFNSHIGRNVIDQYHIRVKSVVRPILIAFFEKLNNSTFVIADKTINSSPEIIKKRYDDEYDDSHRNLMFLRNRIFGDFMYRTNSIDEKTKFEEMVEEVSYILSECISSPLYSDPKVYGMTPDPFYIMFQNVQLLTIMTFINDKIEEFVATCCTSYLVENPLNMYNLVMDIVSADIIELKAPFCAAYLQLRSEMFLYYHSVYPSEVSKNINNLKYDCEDGSASINYMSKYIDDYYKASQELTEGLNGFDVNEVMNKLIDD